MPTALKRTMRRLGFPGRQALAQRTKQPLPLAQMAQQKRFAALAAAIDGLSDKDALALLSDLAADKAKLADSQRSRWLWNAAALQISTVRDAAGRGERD